MKGSNSMTWDTPASLPNWDPTPGIQMPGLRMASSQHRIASLLLDSALIFVTFGIGWFIWSLFTWKDGQSPAKKILKIKVVRDDSRGQVSWGHMALYELFFGVVVASLCSIVNLLTFGLLGSVTYFIFWVTDFCWYWKDGKKRTIRDNVVKVFVVNIA
jgi:uncharacterized RDD family membrane protein YckC